MITVESSRRPFLEPLAECARYRTLFFHLTGRDLKLRFRRTVVGVLWAIVQPVMPMIIFATVFGRVLRPGTGAVPYGIFVLSGLAPWAFFANAVTTASFTFVNNYSLLNKVYFPRAILPTTAVAACIVDWLISSLFLIAFMLWRGFRPMPGWLLLPFVILAGIVLAMAVGLGAASLIVIYRDLKHLFPFLVQIWMYATPVIYPVSMIPRRIHWAAGLNPVAGLVEAYRWCLFGGPADGELMSLSALSAVTLVIGATAVFQHLESDLAERA
jgi:lipopolysaccharide transport system permease protein